MADLSASELRVLGCLIEKQITTPDYYPMTVNALVNACNQSTNRWPVVEYDDVTVHTALDALRERGWARTVRVPGQRSVKYRHVVDEMLQLDVPGLAVLAVLMLRGPQTPGELRTRTGRYHEFADLGSVETVLDGLAGREDPLAERLERGPGEKEARYRHRLGDAGERPRDEAVPGPEVADLPPDQSLEARVARLEQALEHLDRTVQGLTARLDAMSGWTGSAAPGP